MRNAELSQQALQSHTHQSRSFKNQIDSEVQCLVICDFTNINGMENFSLTACNFTYNFACSHEILSIKRMREPVNLYEPFDEQTKMQATKFQAYNGMSGCQ